jgi:hypothetical protein
MQDAPNAKRYGACDMRFETCVAGKSSIVDDHARVLLRLSVLLGPRRPSQEVRVEHVPGDFDPSFLASLAGATGRANTALPAKLLFPTTPAEILAAGH